MGKFSLTKKTTGFILAGAIAFGSIGGTAYAYQDQWTTYLQNGVDKLYVKLSPEIKNETDKKEKAVIAKLSEEVSKYLTGIKTGITAHKDNLIKQNTDELDKYYEDTLSQIKKNGNEISENTKSKLDKVAQEELEKSKSNIDEKVKNQLKAFSNSGTNSSNGKGNGNK